MLTANGFPQEHVEGFRVLHYQNAPKLDARLNAK